MVVVRRDQAIVVGLTTATLRVDALDRTAVPYFSPAGPCEAACGRDLAPDTCEPVAVRRLDCGATECHTRDMAHYCLACRPKLFLDPGRSRLWNAALESYVVLYTAC